MERQPMAMCPPLPSFSLRNAPSWWHVQSAALVSLAGSPGALSQALPIPPGFPPPLRVPVAKEVGPKGYLSLYLGTCWVSDTLPCHFVYSSATRLLKRPPPSPLTEGRPRLRKMKQLPQLKNSTAGFGPTVS